MSVIPPPNNIQSAPPLTTSRFLFGYDQTVYYNDPVTGFLNTEVNILNSRTDQDGNHLYDIEMVGSSIRLYGVLETHLSENRVPA